MGHKKIISIVLPIFNEEANISYIYQELVTTLSAVQERYSYEIIMVDDGSSDKSWSTIKQISEVDKNVVGVHFSRNFGKEIALSAGIDTCVGDCVITMDSDWQHPIEKIYDFLSYWEQGYEIVYNIRAWFQEAWWVKKISSSLFYKIFNSVSEFKLEPGATDYRLLDKIVIDTYKKCGEKNRMYRWLIDWLGFKRKSLIFPSPKRINGKSTYNYRKLLKLAVNNITSFSFFPLKFVWFLGFVTTFCAGILFILQIWDRLWILEIGFSSLGIVVVINTMMMGTVMMSIGLIGLYVANINEEVMRRPLYIVREKIN